MPRRRGGPLPPTGDTLRVEIDVVPPEFLGRAGKGTPRSRFALDMTSIEGTVNSVYDRWVNGD